MNIFLLTWGLIIVAATIDVVAVVIIKNRLNFLGAVKYTGTLDVLSYCFNVIRTPHTFIASLLLVLSPIFYGLALSKIDLSLAYPLIIAVSSIFLISVSYFYLGENLTTKQIIGTLLIVSGVIVIYLK